MSRKNEVEIYRNIQKNTKELTLKWEKQELQNLVHHLKKKCDDLQHELELTKKELTEKLEKQIAIYNKQHSNRIENRKWILINYAHNCCKNSRRKNSESGKQFGFHEVLEYGFHNLSSSFVKKNEHILKQKRGAGYWLWKPKIILDTMDRYPLSENILIFYLDAGAHFVRDVSPLMTRIEKSNQDITVFSMEYAETQWTKRDAFILMDADSEEYHKPPVASATFLIFKNTLKARNFVEKWLMYASDERILTDKPNTMGKPNYPDFRDHRHDQSVLSLLVKKEKIPFDQIGLQDVLAHTRNKS